MTTDKPTTTASAQPENVAQGYARLPEQYRIAIKALIYSRNITNSPYIFKRLGEIINEIDNLHT